MEKTTEIARIETGVKNLDLLLNGGIPKGSAIIVAGAPGTGKTIFAQEFCFHNASAEHPAIYFGTLSEPTAKLLLYLKRFKFFDAKKINNNEVQFVDLGRILRSNNLTEATNLILEHIKKMKPAFIVIDSFKAFDDLAETPEEMRKFTYDLMVHLMAWEATTLLLGEYGHAEPDSKPLFSIADGLVHFSQRIVSGENQRFIQVAKMRGTEHNRDEQAFVISDQGLEIFAPRLTINRVAREDIRPLQRLKTGISKLDLLLGEGIPRGSSLLIGGVAGTGKTALLLEFLYRGAQAGEKGIIFSFEETPERLRSAAHGLGWDLDAEINRGMIEIVFIPQPNIMVESHLLMLRERIEAIQAKRIAVDSVSVFLHKIKDAQLNREKVFQLASIVQNNHAVGFFATDIPYGTNQISRFGVEETVVDGIILLSSSEEGFERQRYVEVYKLRNTAHLKGRHSMVISKGGIQVFPRYTAEADLFAPPPPVQATRRAPTGVPGFDAILGGGVLERSVTLISGSTGIGKSTLALQFIIEGAKKKEPGIYVALEESPTQIIQTAEGMGLQLNKYVEMGLIEIVYLSRQHVRANQFLTILDEKIRTNKANRLVIDGMGHIEFAGLVPEDLSQMLSGLITMFKSWGVTSVITLESRSMFSTDSITDQRVSAIADNLVALRYLDAPGELKPFLSVIKTRGSAHDRGTYYLIIEKGGARIGSRLDESQFTRRPEDHSASVRPESRH